MDKKGFEKNQVEVIGEIISGFTYNHESHGDKFYVVDIQTKRLSGTYDIVPLMISDKMVNVNEDYRGCFVKATGQFRSHNKDKDGKRVLELYVFVKRLAFMDDIYEEDINTVYLDGYICKDPIYRITPMGKEITDIILAVNRQYGRSDYIPCVYWGKNARIAKELTIGDRCSVNGRIQSRTYIKKYDDEYEEERTVYEASISDIVLMDR